MSVGDRVPHSPKRDVDLDRVKALNLERRVKSRCERWDVFKLNALNPVRRDIAPSLALGQPEPRAT